MIDRLFRERLDALRDPLDPGFGFDLIRLSASRTEIVVQQQRDLDAHVHDNDELAALIDRIAARIGGRRVVVHLPAGYPYSRTRGAGGAGAASSRRGNAGGMAGARGGRAAVAAAAAVRKAGADQGAIARCRTVRRLVSPGGAPAMRWCASKAPNASPWSGGSRATTLTRDYFRVEDEAGLRFWIYRDGLYGQRDRWRGGEPKPANWFMHGLFA